MFRFKLSSCFVFFISFSLLLYPNLRVSLYAKAINEHVCMQIAVYERGFPWIMQRVKRVSHVSIGFEEDDLNMFLKAPQDYPMGLGGFEEELNKLLIRPSLKEDEWIASGLFGNIIVCGFLSFVPVVLVQFLCKRLSMSTVV